MNVKIFKNEAEFTASAADFIEGSCKKGASIALSGGKTPAPIYKALSTRDISGVGFFQTDERYVPISHPDSNAGMINSTLGKDVVFRHFDTFLPIEESLETYEAKLPMEFNLMVLGIGPDGHIASLFPKDPALLEAGHKTTHTTTDNFPVHDRLTLTLIPILQSKKILVLLKGEDKKAVLEKLTDNKDKSIMDFPAHVLTKHQDVTVYASF